MSYRNSPIAVIGMALRAPGADTPEAFWANILAGLDTLTRPTATQLRRAGVPEHLIQNPMYVRSRPLLKEPGAFDPAFFGMSAQEAKVTDPSHRQFLTCAWEAMERAGVVPGSEAGVVGVFGGCGVSQDNYTLRNFGGGVMDLDDPAVWLPINVGGAPDHLTSRVCFKLDLKGGCNLSVNAACATSLVAVHLAVRALCYGECNLALAGGASIHVPHWSGYLSVEGGPVSPSGTIWAFDARADGTIFGSGAGVVVLKRLDEALAHGDHIHAVILGTGISNDGGQKQSFTAPGIDGQVVAISRALEAAVVSAETIGFVEAHGTGTLLGDPIEVQATSQVFQKDTLKRQFCALGAVKPNIGHTGAAAGVLSLIKTCMALENGIIPPNAHFESPNPLLDLPATPFYIPTESTPWHPEGHPRRAGVSAFGFGGNNAHAVLEAPPPRPARETENRAEMVLLSARTPTALERQIERLADHLDTHPGLCLADVAHTLQTGRKAFEHRAAVVASRTSEAKNRLASRSVHHGQAREKRSVIFALPGQGSQRAGMGRALYDEDPIYRAEVVRCAEMLLPHLDLDIRSLLHAESDDAIEKIQQTAFLQPVLFVVEYALARRLMACGIKPASMIGHSVGEMVAACLAGVFSLPDALSLVALRGRLMQACFPGSMMAIFLPSAEVQARLESDIEISGFNAPDVTVVSGPHEAIERIGSRLEDEGVTHRILKTSHGFHSRSMEPAVKPYLEAVSRVQRSAPSLPFISNVTGRLITDSEATDPGYWANHIRQPVRFAQGIEALEEMAGAVWLEVGPGGALSSLIRRQRDGVTIVSALDGDLQGRAGFLEVLSRLWVEGVPLNWSGLGQGSGKRKVILPTYPFENRNYWIDPPVFQPERRADQVPAEEDTPQEEKWLHVPAWREEPLRTPALSADEGWLIFEDGAGFGAKLRESLREAGVRVLSLLAGEQFEKSGTDVFRVRPGVADDLLAVLQEGAASGWTPRRILHLWQVIGEPGEKEEPLKAFDDCLGPGFDTLTALVNAIHAQGIDEEVQVTVAADGVAALEGEDRPACWEKASLLGPCRVAPLEMPSLSFQLIDVPAAALSAAWLAKGLLAEASAPEPGTLKALRESGRYIEIFRPLPEAFGGGGLRFGGVALITGGMGGLGLEVAGRLFDMARMRLALLTRWQPPPVEDWPSRAEANDRIGQALRKVLALKARGAEVLVVRGDSAVADDMARVVEQVRAHFGAIHGVVHAAGASSPRLVLEAGRQRADEVLTPKVKGALILEQLLGDDPLDFFISFSSIAGVAPVAGQVDYSAANAVLDALARRWAPSSWARYCSISWDAWQEVGMAVDKVRRKTVAELPDLSQGPVGEAVDHPLWQYCRRESGRVLFAGVLRPSEHWVVDEHRLNGVATTPGSGIMEMVHGAFRHLRGADVPVAIRGVAFLQLLQVPEEGLEVWLVCKDDGGETHFELRSCAPGSGGHRLEDLTLHTTGTIAPLEGSAPAIKIPSGELHPRGAYHDSIIWSGPHWNRLLVNVTPGDDETVMRISLPQEYRPENLIYGLHPAVLDFALSHVPYTRLKHEGVPSAIGELRVYRRLPASVIAIVRDAPNGGGAVSVVIADERGEVVAEAEDFLQVRLGRDRVREEALERRLDIRDVGDLSTLELVPLDILPPQAGEVQIQVYAAGLNFRDVLTALGGLSDDGTEGAPVGGECSGRIVAVGPDVKAFSVGDSVMAVGRGAFATRINADARLVARKPVKLSFEEAAGALIAYLTAEYALNHLGRLKGGERVLIHSAAGGVGLAAIQIATAAGAEIYATAGSEEKRAYLRDLGLKHVMDSRTLDFVEAIRNQTGGAGVDVVLNSLAGEFIPAGLEVLRPYGRFLEIGKRDIYKNTPIGLLPFRNNLSLHAIDLSPMIRERHPLLVRMFGELVDALEQRRLKPGPVLAVPWQKTRQAMEHMAGARHIGKVVLVMRKPSERAHGGLTEEEAFKQRYERSIPLQRGLDIFQELLQGAELPPHVIVSSRSFESEADRHEAPALQSGGASERQRASLVVYKAPSNPTEEKIVEIWEQILSVESLGVDDAFLELGGDSIMAIQILSRVRKAFGVRLPQNALFENPTVVSLSRAVLKQLEQINNDEVVRVLAEVEALSDEEAERNLADTQALDK